METAIWRHKQQHGRRISSRISLWQRQYGGFVYKKIAYKPRHGHLFYRVTMDNGTIVGDSVGQRKRQAEYYREYRKRALPYCENVVHEKKKYNTYCLDVVTSISVMNRMIKTTLFFFSSKCRLFHNATLFGSCIIHILNTGCAKI
jgi:hypothetical protein